MARRAKTVNARSRARSGRPSAASITPRMARQERSGASASAPTSTRSWVAARPDRTVFVASRCHPVTGSFSRPAITSSRSAPASSRLAKAMSPAMPAKQCHQATFVNGLRRWWAATRSRRCLHLAGRSGPFSAGCARLPTPLRNRCRCRRRITQAHNWPASPATP